MSTQNQSPDEHRSALSEFDRRAIGMVGHLLTIGLSLERKIGKSPKLFIGWAAGPDSKCPPGPRISKAALFVDRPPNEEVSRNHAPAFGSPLLRCVPDVELKTAPPTTKQESGQYQWA
jgi:hypothetical protein